MDCRMMSLICHGQELTAETRNLNDIGLRGACASGIFHRLVLPKRIIFWRFIQVSLTPHHRRDAP